MKRFVPLLFLVALFPFTAFADVEPDYNPGEPSVTTAWYEMIGAAQKQADVDFIIGMRPHHAGALSMSEEYLADKDGRSDRLRRLAKAIIYNQTFEIGVMEEIEAQLNKVQIPDGQDVWARVATEGLAQNQKFLKQAIPSLVQPPGSNDTASETDVLFAKAMIVHHAGALDMCEGYLGSPDVNNGYLERLCKDILVDQAQEIALMEDIIADYPGDADVIRIDPSMIDGMDHMLHGGHAGHNRHMDSYSHYMKTAKTKSGHHHHHM